MPELPEVQTTVSHLKEKIPGLIIKDVWSCYDSPYYKGKRNIKDKDYFKQFKREVTNKKILSVERKGKNILIHLSKDITILTHMKMSGHFLYGEYIKTPEKEKQVFLGEWIAEKKGPLKDDPFNRFIRIVFTLSNKKHLTLSDSRKFATIYIYKTKSPPNSLLDLGPDPLDKNFTFKTFLKRLPYLSNKPIKQILLDHSVISGIGNIYSDEMLFSADIHPKSILRMIPRQKLYSLYSSMKFILRQGITLNGDSFSDYRKPDGERGSFHHHHSVYQKKGERCSKRGCKGVIEREIIGNRSSHFCNQHQVLYFPKKLE